ncbi:hypothetical protein O181_040247 [Austropuccinia psidii MF-1]|uniref:DinB-like domain-containing protein n=1 Tax=Austropuccinia psidii MF-1 TaxID=1389203 RepID=A0A9Q3HDP3_9BASI|nr:hypothetical protein [Austropuccinia psidii MF-1]
MKLFFSSPISATNSVQLSTNPKFSIQPSEQNPQDKIIQNPQQQLVELKKIGLGSLDQAIHLLRNVITQDAQLTNKSKIICCGTVGKHLRHLHDHFKILLETSESRTNTLNYDVRRKNNFMENSRQVALNEFETTRNKLIQVLDSRIQNLNQDQKLNLISVTPAKMKFQTSFNRELWFAISHAIHHFALIRAIVTRELSLKLPQSFGVAPNTIINFKSKL